MKYGLTIFHADGDTITAIVARNKLAVLNFLTNMSEGCVVEMKGQRPDGSVVTWTTLEEIEKELRR